MRLQSTARGFWRATAWDFSSDVSMYLYFLFDLFCIYNVFFFVQTFQEKEELLRNMMGLLGNVAEVQHLRPKLMTGDFVLVFANLLDSQSDGIEVISIYFSMFRILLKVYWCR
jgi:hypothetical protein